MRILKQGTRDGGRKYTATCNGCGTKIEFLQKEATRVSDQRDGDYMEIQCPTCPRRITKAYPTVCY